MSQLPMKHAADPAGPFTPAAPPQPASPATPDAAALLRAFRRRWPSALGGGLLLAAVAAAVAWFAVPPAKYTATGTLHVAMIRPKILFPTAEQEAEYATYQKTQMAQIKSRVVLDEVIRDPEVARLDTVREVAARQADPSEWLDKQVTVEFTKGSEILQVSMSGDRPKDVEVITNKVIEKYMKLVVDSDGSERKRRIETLRGLWDRYQENLKEKRRTMRKLAVEAGSDDRQTLSMKGQLAHELMAQTEAERLKTKGELNRLLMEISVLEGDQKAQAGRPAEPAAAAVPDDVLDEYLEGDPYAVKQKEYVERCLSRYQGARRLARGDSEPSLVLARQQLERARKARADYREKLRPAVARKLGGARAEPAADLTQLKRKAAVLKRFEESLVKDVERIRNDIQKLNENTLDLQTEQDEISMLAETAKRVGAEVEAMDVEIKAPERIRIVDASRAPRARDELKKLKVTGGAAAGAFACVLVGVTVWETRARRVNTADEVVKGLGIRLFGSLPAPQDPSRRQAGGRAKTRASQSVLVESVDATRTMLLHAAREDSLRVVMVTSADAGEGKTTLSCHLTASLARAGRKTLLIDCDLRRPAAHRLFDLPAGPGVSELLRGEADLDTVIRQTQASDLHVIPAGVCDGAAVQAVAQGGLQSVFEELRSRYDFIIVDSAPVLPVVDSLIISQHTDAVIFSILRDVSRVPAVQDARDRLSALGVRILGAVVSGMPGQSYAARYGDVTADSKAVPAAQQA